MPGEAKTILYSDILSLIVLPPPVPGFDHFIGTWLYKGDLTFIVDVGPLITIDSLLDTLKNKKIEHLDYVFLTHIHIDHSGGLGKLIAHFPDTTIVCHEKGINHLVQPDKLWTGTKKALGDLADSYGKILPVPRTSITGADHFKSDLVKIIPTPGHSPHHLSLLADDYLFAGEAGGVFLETGKNELYLRPATPPKFYFDTFINSIENLLEICPENICYGHSGISGNGVRMLELHRDQLYLWKDIIESEVKRGPENDLVDACLKKLQKEDPLISSFSFFDKNTRKREEFFLKNSIKGFIEYFTRAASNK